MKTFPKYKCNVKFSDTTTGVSIKSEDQHKWLIHRCSACLKKRLASTTLIEKTKKFSSLINNSTASVYAIRNLNDNNIQNDLPLTKKPSQTTRNFDDSIIFNISEKQLSPSGKSVLEKGLNFCPETSGYGKLKLMDNLFWFCRNLRLGEFFHEDTGTATNNKNTVYNKKQERTDMSKKLKNFSFSHFTHHKTTVINSTNIFHQKTELSTYATKNISIINKT